MFNKLKIFFIFLIFLNFLNTLYCLENYVSKILVSERWGTKSNEFGLIKGQEIETIGPNTFNIGRKGNIFIFDSVNKVIKKYDKKGEFISNFGNKIYGSNIVTDDNEQIYVLDGQILHLYTSSGNIVESTPISKDIQLDEGYGEGMKLDDFGNIFIKKSQKSYQISKRINGKFKKLSEKEHLKSERFGMPNRKKNKWFKIRRENKHRTSIQVINDNGNILKEISDNISDSFGTVLFIDQDKFGFIYAETERITDDNYVHLEVRKYDENGNLVKIVELENSYYTTVYKKIEIDDFGNIYQLLTTPDGVQIIK